MKLSAGILLTDDFCSYTDFFFFVFVEELFILHYGKGKIYLLWRANKTHLSQMS